MLCWAAMAFIVVIGAPIGSLVLTPASIPFLRFLFYVLAVTQFILFGALKIQGNLIVWSVAAAITVVTVIGLAVHFALITLRRQQAAKKSERAGVASSDVASKEVAVNSIAAQDGGESGLSIAMTSLDVVTTKELSTPGVRDPE